jgi:GTPase
MACDVVETHRMRSATYPVDDSRDMLRDQPCLDEESEDGSVEYKWWLAAPSDRSRLERLATQMNFRVNEGDGRCTYVLGVRDDGTLAGIDKHRLSLSCETLMLLAATIGCRAYLRSLRQLDGGAKWCAQWSIARGDYPEVSIAWL